MATVDIAKFDPKKLIYGKPKDMPNKIGRTIDISYRNDEKTNTLLVQTTKMYAPFGISMFKNKKEGGTKKKKKQNDEKEEEKEEEKISYVISLSFRGMEVNEPMKKFFDFLLNLDSAVLEQAKKKSAEWFPQQKDLKTQEWKPKSSEVIEGMLTPSVKENPPDSDYADAPPTIKGKLIYRGGKILTGIFDREKNPITFDQVSGGSQVICLLECTGVWYVQGKFGVSWSCQQIKNYGGGLLTQYALRTDSDDEEEAHEPSPKRRKIEEREDEKNLSNE